MLSADSVAMYSLDIWHGVGSQDLRLAEWFPAKEVEHRGRCILGLGVFPQQDGPKGPLHLQ